MLANMVNTVRALGNETKALTVESVTKQCRNLIAREKNFLFNYLKEGDIEEHLRIIANDPQHNIKINEPIDSYKTNVYVIVESFFTYGFKPALLQAQEDRQQTIRGKKNRGDIDLIEMIGEQLASGQEIDADEEYEEAWMSLGQIPHFWVYLAKNLGMLETVQFVNFHYKEDQEDRQKGMVWVICALNDDGVSDMRIALKKMMEDSALMKIYDQEQSYMTQNKDELFEALDVLQQKDLYLDTKTQLIPKFKEWKQQRETQKAERRDEMGEIGRML